MTTDPDEAAAVRGHLRAAHADRERVIEALKAAFVQGRLDTHELDDRVGRAFVSRTYAELAALTADLPVSQADAGPARAGPPGSPARTLATAALRAGLCILVPFVLLGLLALTHVEFFAGLAYYCGIGAAIAASGFLGYGVVDAWQERRSGGHPPAAGARRTGAVPG